jgi:type II secretory pathway pseudopilin PulG
MRPRGQEAGFTIVEVLVAAVILVIGALTTFGMLSAATRSTERGKATQIALDVAQQELEALRGDSFEELALKATPAPSNQPLDPGYRVDSTNGTFALSREPRGNYQKLVENGGELYGGSGEEGVVRGGEVNPGPTPFESGDVRGQIYRYVVWRNDPSCSEEKCPGPQDFKQIVVAVKLDKFSNEAGERGYVEVQSDFIDPTDSAANDPAPNSEGKVVTAQQFFLTDTPCSASGSTERLEITGDHPLHNTLGTCASGLREGPEEGTTPGAPDALLLGHPPDPEPENTEIPLLYDYSNDYYLSTNPDTAKGVQIPPDATNGCHYEPTGTTHPESQVHRWVTDPMATNFTMTEKATLEFYTRTLNDALYHGTLCVYLYDRHEEERESELVATDTRLTDKVGATPYWTYTPEGNEYWPRNSWTKVRLTMAFNEAPYTIPAGDRLGVALSVDRANTPPETALAIMYDHPDYPTRIEVDTSTPIEGG